MPSVQYAGYDQPFFIVTWVEFIVAILLLIARCVTAFYILGRAKPDLYLAGVTFALGVASMIMLTIGASYGLGVPEEYLSLPDRHSALLFGWINQFIALFSIGMGKLAIVAFLEQIQGYHTKYRTFILWFLAGSNLVVNIIAAIFIFLQCSPTGRLWNVHVPGACTGRKRVQIFGYIQGPWSAFCDFALALFPIIIFARVQAFSIATKAGLCILMSCGIVAGACAIVKTIKLEYLTDLGDATNTLPDVIVWNETEMWVVFIVSCIPPTKAFFWLALKKGTGSFSSMFKRVRSREPSQSTQSG